MTDVVQHQAPQTPEITLTEVARKHIIRFLSARPRATGIRFSVKKTGCSGLSYVVDPVENQNEDDLSLPFEENYKIYIDRKSYPYLKGLQIDYVKQGLNQKFTYSNPNQTGQCGCGESFTVE